MKGKNWLAALWCLLFSLAAAPVSAATVPFVMQAPGGRWSEPRFQDGCEEASALMAALWATDKPAPDSAAAAKILLAAADWQQEKFGGYHDTSAEDTAERLLKTYWGLNQVSVEAKVSKDAIIKKLAAGQLVLVPTDGRKLKNPYFQRPGPSTHMLVIISYDRRRQRFIVNDPGTKRGSNYAYPAETLMAAINDYPSGKHLKRQQRELRMIVVGKQQHESKKD